MPSRRLALVLALACAAAGCAVGAPGRPDALSGTSGAVSWEVAGNRTVIRPDGREIEWSYTLILRNTAGPDIAFEMLETSAQNPAVSRQELLASVSREAFLSRLTTASELRVNASYRTAFTAATAGGFGELPGGREGIVVQHRFLGKDARGSPVTVAVRVPLDPAAGRRVAPGPARPAALPGSPAPAAGAHDEPGVIARTSADAPEAPRPPSPRPGSGPGLLEEAARDCQAGFPAIEVVHVEADGRVTWHTRDVGKSAPFQACYEERVRAKVAGRRVPAPAPADRASVALEREGGGLTVRAVVGPSQPARLLLDTGAGKMVLRPNLLERLGVAIPADAVRVELTTLSGERLSNVPLARVDALSVGGATVADLYVAAYDLLPQLPDVDGVLGSTFSGTSGCMSIARRAR